MTETAPADRTAAREAWVGMKVRFDSLIIIHILVMIGASRFAVAFMQPMAAGTDTSSIQLPTVWVLQLAIAVPVLAFLLTRDHWLIQKIVHAVFQGFVLLVPVLCLYLLGVFLIPTPIAGLADPASLLCLALAAGVTAAAYFINRVITHDALALVTIAIFSGICGSVIGPLPCMAFLGAMLVLDFFEVYIAKYMIVVVDRMARLRLMPAFLLPPTLGAFLDRPPQEFGSEDGERRWMLLGLGDLGIPTLLVVSCIMFLPGPGPALGAGIGIIMGYKVLGYLALAHNRPHAGLPPIAGGALIGCVLGAVLTGVPLW